MTAEDHSKWLNPSVDASEVGTGDKLNSFQYMWWLGRELSGWLPVVWEGLGRWGRWGLIKALKDAWSVGQPTRVVMLWEEVTGLCVYPWRGEKNHTLHVSVCSWMVSALYFEAVAHTLFWLCLPVWPTWSLSTRPDHRSNSSQRV